MRRDANLIGRYVARLRDERRLTQKTLVAKVEILNYFGTGATNAYTEAANGLAKIANRNGRGYSFEAIRAKIIYGGSGKRGKFCESPVDEEIFAEMTRPVVETPQPVHKKETDGVQ